MLALGLAKANEPIAAIKCWADNSIAGFQRCKRRFYISRLQLRGIAADVNERARPQSRREALHALAKIAFSLTDHESGAQTLCWLIGRDRQAKPPARVRAQTLQKSPERDALKTVRGAIPDVSGQAAFALTKNWPSRHQHQCAISDHKDVRSVQSARQS
jgi:hypothetical protein